ncbi:tape measure protein [Elizabethkingia meningoseptica]|uniref:tape measure protein n=2 Tax=Bacteroidota TaxID=976 RepID=UPI001624C84B|nr:tape measure protein [Elizabethkingia meningoseptica]MBG0514101.1 tape measure protein [Elizabethkingia meningoseptica]
MSDKLAIVQGQETIDELNRINAALDPLIVNFNKLVEVAKKAGNAFNSGKPKEYNEATKESKDIIDKLTKAQNDLALTNKRLAEAEQKLANAILARAKAQVEVSKASIQEKKAEEALNRALIQEAKLRGANADAARKEIAAEAAATRAKAQGERQSKNTASAYFNLSQQTKNYRDKARDSGAQVFQLNQALKSGSISQQEYNQKIKDATRDFNEAIKKAKEYNNAIKNINSQVNGSSPSGVNKNQSIGKQVSTYFAGLFSFDIFQRISSGIYSMGESAIETSKKIETLRLSQLAVFKTQEEVGRQNEFLTRIANRYGVEILGLSNQYTQFQAAAQGTILEGKKAQNIFESVTRASSMLGVSADDTQGILKALGQMMSKGKIQAEELRGQLGDRMAGAFKLFADGMGITTSQLDELLKKGGVLAENVLPKFAEQLDKKYFLGLGEEIDTSQAALARMNNAWTNFVEGIDSGSGVISGSIKMVTNSITNMLNAFTPDAALIAIDKEQQALNVLGLQLRQNWNDENARKDIINQIIQLNPYFLDGLDKEKVTLSEIEERLRGVNAQYAQKYILQEKQNEISKLYKQEAEALKNVADMITSAAPIYNSLSSSSKAVFDNFSAGRIPIEKATEAIKKNGDYSKALESVMISINDQYKTGTKSIFGYTRSINDVRKDLNKMPGEYQNLINVTNNLISKNGQLIDFNHLLAGSFMGVGREADIAAARITTNYNAALKRSRQLGENFFQADTMKQKDGRGKDGRYWFDSKTGKNTMKDTSEWDLIDGKLVKRKPLTTPDKEKKYTGAKLSGEQKDALMNMQADRDNQLAENKRARIEGLKTEEDYWKRYEQIYKVYGDRVQAYLKGLNAKERQVSAAASKKAIDELEKAQDEVLKIYDDKAKQSQRNLATDNKERRDIILNDDELTNVERTALLVAADQEYYQNLNQSYAEQIELTKSYNRSIIKLVEDRNNDLQAINARLRESGKKLLTDAIADLEVEQSRLDSQSSSAEAEAKIAIYADKKLTIQERSYRLTKLELDTLLLTLTNRKYTLENEKRIYEEQAKKGPLNEKEIDQYNKINDQLDDTNVKLTEATTRKRELVSTKELNAFKATNTMFDFLSKGFDDLGLGGVADQFKTMYDAILLSQDEFNKKYGEGQDKWKVAEIAAIQAVGAISQSIMQDNLNRKLSLYDEELKASQSRTDAELAIIQSRLDFLNAVDNASTEQIEQRNALEDEYRVIKEQQLEREKMIAMQKAKAEQQASAQQALINGSLAATATLAQTGFAGWPMALAALAFGVLQSSLIMSRNPVPQYFTGTDYAPEGMAITQEYGREIITDKHGRIKSLGNERGATKTWLSEGDKVFNATQTKEIMKSLTDEPLVMGQNIYARALSGQRLDIPPVINHNSVNADEIADKVGQKFDKTMAKYSTASVYEVDGFVYKERPGKYPEVVGKSKKQSINVKISKNGRD